MRPDLFAPLDGGLTLLLGLGRRLPSLALEGRLLAGPRRSEGLRIAQRLRPSLADIEPLVVDRDPEAIAAYDGLVNEAVDDLRLHDERGLSGLVSSLDRRSLLLRPEYCDSASCPEEQRRNVLTFLDWLNEGLHSYETWASLMADDLRPVGGRPARVLDLAAGHGGFALALKERHGAALDVTASDLFDEYLALGREQARRRGLDVAFVCQDATDLQNLADARHDVVVCTQSIHHFPPGMVGRMLGEAARIARRSVWFIDGERSLAVAALLALVAGARGRAWPPVHDTIVSLRKMYAEEELSLIGSLAPGLPPGARVSTGREAPGFAYLRVQLP